MTDQSRNQSVKQIISFLGMIVLVIFGIYKCQSGSSSRSSSKTEELDAPMHPKAKEIESKQTVLSARGFHEKIVCNEFGVEATLKGSTLKIQINTDLPDYTDMSISVSREITAKGEKYAIPVDYYYNKSETVGNWRSVREITIDHSAWFDSVRERQEEWSKIGEVLELKTIGREITVQAVVHGDQSDPRFGESNKNLIGSAIITTGSHFAESKKQFSLKIRLPAKFPKKIPSLYAPDLDLNVWYELDRNTPLMPELNPVDPMAAITQVQTLPAGSQIAIKQKKQNANVPWYQVRSRALNGTPTGQGWINSNALRGQNLRLSQ